VIAARVARHLDLLDGQARSSARLLALP